MSASRHLTAAEAREHIAKLPQVGKPEYPYITDGKKICVICEITHESNEIEMLASGVEDDITWADYKCLITGETWTHLSHAAIPDTDERRKVDVTDGEQNEL